MAEHGRAWQRTITVQGDTIGVSSALGSKEEWRIGYTAQVSVKLDTFVAAGRYWVGKAPQSRPRSYPSRLFRDKRF